MTENPKSKIQNPGSRILWLLFALLIVFVYFFGLTLPLLGPDEPRYAQVAREMYLRGDWITPTLGGFDWFEKPALLYWLEIASYKIFGVSEFAARFGSAVFGLGTIACLWILGKSVSGFRFQVSGEKIEILKQTSEIQKPETRDLEPETRNLKPETRNLKPETSVFANWLALIAASSIGLIVFSRGASFDIILTFPITAALVCYFLFESLLQKHYFCAVPNSIVLSKSTAANLIAAAPPIAWASLFLAGFYFFIGFALLAKGLIGLIFPLTIVFFYHLLKFELLPGKVFLISLIWGTIISLLVASIWYLPMYRAHGWKFVDEFFIQHQFQRFTSDKYQHQQPFWFFFVVLPLMTLPWLPFFLASIWNFFKVQGSRFKVQSSRFNVQGSNNLSTLDSRLAPFAFAWLAVPLVFFSLSGSKLPGYILPALPGAIVLTAIYVADFVRKSRTRTRVLQIAAASTFLFVFVGLQFFAADYTNYETVKNMIAAADAKGFADAEFVSLYTVSHNLEFYAAGRLERDADGKLKRYDDFSVLIKAVKTAGDQRILVVVPQANVPNLQKENDLADIETIAENGESAIILIKPKR